MSPAQHFVPSESPVPLSQSYGTNSPCPGGCSQEAEQPSLSWRLSSMGTPKGKICPKVVFLPCAILQTTWINPRYQQEMAWRINLSCIYTTYQWTTAGGKKSSAPFLYLLVRKRGVGREKKNGKEKKKREKKIKRKKERANFPQQQPASILIHESPSCRNLLF